MFPPVISGYVVLWLQPLVMARPGFISLLAAEYNQINSYQNGIYDPRSDPRDDVIYQLQRQLIQEHSYRDLGPPSSQSMRAPPPMATIPQLDAQTFMQQMSSFFNQQNMQGAGQTTTGVPEPGGQYVNTRGNAQGTDQNRNF